jgi:hypothetical protein
VPQKKEKSSLSISNFADFLALDIVGGYFDSSLLSPSCRTRTMWRRNSGLSWIQGREPPHPNPVLPPCKAEFLVGAGMTAAMMFWRTSLPVRILSHFSPRGCSLVTQRHSGVVAHMRGFATVFVDQGENVFCVFSFRRPLKSGGPKDFF